MSPEWREERQGGRDEDDKGEGSHDKEDDEGRSFEESERETPEWKTPLS